MPATFDAYYEPFVGAGALFFALQPARAVLGDTNRELISCYEAVRDDPRNVERILRGLPKDREGYYRVRSTNPTEKAERAAKLIYLTTLAFNGIYRVNAKGEFNVPYGGRQYSTLGAPGSLSPQSEALRGAQLRRGDFAESVEGAGAGDLVYLDPPYTVMHSSNGFVRYNERIFSWSDQVRLAGVAEDLRDRGCMVFVSNADHESVRQLYPNFRSIEFQRASSMAASSSNRRQITEVVLTNAPEDRGGVHA